MPQRYFLSAKACSGILRRADAKGRVLPVELRQMLEKQAYGIDAPQVERERERHSDRDDIHQEHDSFERHLSDPYFPDGNRRQPGKRCFAEIGYGQYIETNIGTPIRASGADCGGG